jgi:hypothetical protein
MGNYLFIVITLAIAGFSGVPSSQGSPVVEQLINKYAAIQTLSCSVQREMVGPQGSARFLSRLFYKRPDHMHVQNYSPVKRRYIADGERMFYHIDGDKMGFSRPIDQLNEDWLISLRAIPATPMNQLLRLRDGVERELPATDEFPVRTACITEKAFAILCQDTKGRLARIEYYSTEDLQVKAAQYDYSQFSEYGDGILLPLLHEAFLNLGAEELTETSRFGNVSVNSPLADQLFVAAPYFKDVIFKENFEEIYP